MTKSALDSAWYRAVRITYLNQVIQGGNDGPYETDRSLPEAKRQELTEAVSFIAARTGVSEGYVQYELNEAGYTHGRAPGSDADPDYFAPPDWDLFQ
jgi:hypothetical protein